MNVRNNDDVVLLVAIQHLRGRANYLLVPETLDWKLLVMRGQQVAGRAVEVKVKTLHLVAFADGPLLSFARRLFP